MAAGLLARDAIPAVDQPARSVAGRSGVAVTLSCTTKINVGILSMALAWIIGVDIAGRPVNDIFAGSSKVPCYSRSRYSNREEDGDLIIWYRLSE